MANTGSSVSDSLLLLTVLKRIPHNRWISTVALMNELAEAGTPIPARRLQRVLQRLCSSEEFSVVRDTRAKPYGYRRMNPKSDLGGTRLKPEECVVLRLAEEQMKYLLPTAVMESLRPLFDRARETMKESPVGDTAAGWLKKVATVPGKLPVMPAKILPRIFSSVSKALWNNTKLDIEYENSAGDVKTGTVSPLGLVQQDERTYLVCVFEGFKDVRHLALHRLRSAKALPFVADRPDDFELDAYVAVRHFNFSNGEKVCLVLESDDGYLKRYLTETPFNPTQQLTELTDGFWRCEAVLDDSPLIDAWAAMWGEERFRRFERWPCV
mgnify:FL=1